MKMTSAITLLLIATTANAAGIHKCKDASGNVSYSQSPCACEGSQLDIQSQPGQQMDAATAAEITRQRVESMNRATNLLKGPAKLPRWAVEKPKPTKISAGDQMRLDDIDRSIQIRQESRISNNQDEIDALQAERRKIYAKYGIDDPNRRQRASASVAVEQPQYQHPIPMTDGRVLIPNDPDGRSFTSNDGVVYTRSGSNVLINTQTGETVILH